MADISFCDLTDLSSFYGYRVQGFEGIQKYGLEIYIIVAYTVTLLKLLFLNIQLCGSADQRMSLKNKYLLNLFCH